MQKNLTYGELLLSSEWKEKREQIIHRDNKTCKRCNNKSYENEGFYGPYWRISNIKSPYIRFDAFGDKSQQIFLQDANGVALIPDQSKVMLYLSKHKPNGIGDIARDGYFVAAARELTLPELEHYYPFEKPGISVEEKAKLICRVIDSKPELPKHNELIELQIEKQNWIFAKDLHVHHTYYQIGRMPWEYPDESLVTLCRTCHHEVHEMELIPVIGLDDIKIGYYLPCDRCSGAGWFPEYTHIENGICFKCRGIKYLHEEFIRILP